MMLRAYELGNPLDSLHCRGWYDRGASIRPAMMRRLCCGASAPWPFGRPDPRPANEGSVPQSPVSGWRVAEHSPLQTSRTTKCQSDKFAGRSWASEPLSRWVWTLPWERGYIYPLVCKSSNELLPLKRSGPYLVETPRSLPKARLAIRSQSYH